jgi:hypothetical protein
LTSLANNDTLSYNSSLGYWENKQPTGGGDTSISGTTVLNFGNETDSVTLTINNASITNTNIKNISFIPKETSETSLDDFSLNAINFNIENIVNNTSFDIRATAINNASGNFTVKYLIQI